MEKTHKKINKDIPLRIKQVRKILGLIQKEMCEKISVDRTTLSHMENGTGPITERNCKSILKAFPQINPDWFYKGIGEPLMSQTPQAPPGASQIAEPGVSYVENTHEVLESPQIPPLNSSARGNDEAGGFLNNKEVIDLLRATQEILTSPNRMAVEALRRNIQYFSHAVNLENRTGTLEQEIEHLKREVGRLKGEEARRKKAVGDGG